LLGGAAAGAAAWLPPADPVYELTDIVGQPKYTVLRLEVPVFLTCPLPGREPKPLVRGAAVPQQIEHIRKMCG